MYSLRRLPPLFTAISSCVAYYSHYYDYRGISILSFCFLASNLLSSTVLSDAYSWEGQTEMTAWVFCVQLPGILYVGETAT